MTVAEAFYLLDANVFITAARNYYALDVVPSFWVNLARLASEGRIKSIDRVKQELLKGNDSLAEWISNTIPDAFESTREESVITSYRKIIGWAMAQPKYKQSAKDEFARVADGWLVAYALSYSLTVVTHEVPDPMTKKKILIPIVCEKFDVPYINTFAMLREIGIKI